jgi:hypothetical protein
MENEKMDVETSLDEDSINDLDSDGNAKQITMLSELGYEDDDDSLEIKDIEDFPIEIFKDYNILERLDDRDFKKDIAIIHSTAIGFDTIDQRLFNVIYKIADSYKFEQETYLVPKKLIKEALGREKNHYEQLKASFEKILNTKIVCNIFDQDKKQEWGTVQSALIGAFELTRDSNIIRFTIPEILRERMAHPNIYANINHKTTSKLSFRSIKLYEYFLGELDRQQEDYVDNIVIDEKHLRTLLDAMDVYPRYAMFIYKCVSPAIAEINGKTTLDVVHTQKGKRKKGINYAHFTAKRGENKYESKIKLVPLPHGSGKEKLYKDICKQNEKSYKKLIEMVEKEYPGYGEQDIDNHILMNIAYSEKQNPKNLLAYVTESLKNNYAKYISQAQKITEENKETNHSDEIARKKEEVELLQRERKRQQELSKQLGQANLIELGEVWQKSLDCIKKEHPYHETWSFGTQLFTDNEHNILLVAPHALAANIMNKHHLELIKTAISEKFNKIATFRIEVADDILKKL